MPIPLDHSYRGARIDWRDHLPSLAKQLTKEHTVPKTARGSKGIGKEIARGLMHRSMRVMIVGRNTQVEIQTAKDIRAEFLEADLSSIRAATKLVAVINGKTASRDVLVHSAGQYLLIAMLGVGLWCGQLIVGVTVM
jgi:short chain dehydrogenase